MSNISNKLNESSKNKSTKSIAEGMGLKRVQSSESEKGTATSEPKVKRKKKGLEQITEPEKQVSDRSIHFSGSSSAMDAYLSKMEEEKLSVPSEDLGKLVNKGDVAGVIEEYLERKDRLNLQSLNKTSAERRLSGDELRVVLTEEDLLVPNNEKLKFAKDYGGLKIRTSKSNSPGGAIQDFVEFATNRKSALTYIEVLELNGCSVVGENLCPMEEFKNVLKECPNISRIVCDYIGDNLTLTLEEMPELTYVKLGNVDSYGSIELKNLPKLQYVFTNNSGNITLEDLPNLEFCSFREVRGCARFIGEFPKLKTFICSRIQGFEEAELIFPEKLNSLVVLKFEEIYGSQITFPQELNALETIAFGPIRLRDVILLRLPNLPKLKKISCHWNYTPESVLEVLNYLQSQIDAREQEKAKGENS